MGKRSVHLSIVIPAYNEEKRIGSSLETVTQYLSQQAYESEVVVVDDGSSDDTATLVRQRYPNVRVISYEENRGKGYAVKSGMLSAIGEYRVYYDADASTPIEELEKLWRLFEDGADIVLGSRSLPESRVEVRQSWVRQQMGRTFNLVLRLLALTSFPDTQCGFKGFTAAACEAVFPKSTVKGFGFDAELLYIASLQGLRIEQTPVRWVNSPESKVRMLSDSMRMLVDAFGIRLNALRGRYS